MVSDWEKHPGSGSGWLLGCFYLPLLSMKEGVWGLTSAKRGTGGKEREGRGRGEGREREGRGKGKGREREGEGKEVGSGCRKSRGGLVLMFGVEVLSGCTTY